MVLEIIIAIVESHFFKIFIILLVCGIVGGLANYDISTDHSKSYSKTKLSSVILGIVAAFTVPLFLKMISSDILIKSQKEPTEFFVIIGFALIASVFSRNFLSTIYDRLMQRVDKLEKRMEDVTDEPNYPEEGEISKTHFKDEGLTEEELKIMIKMASSKYPSRSLDGLKRDTGIERGKINETFNVLMEKGLVEQSLNSNQELRWYLSSKGRSVLAKLSKQVNA